MKNKIITFSFLGILIITLMLNIFASDKKVSESERRKLAQLPKLSYQTILSGEFFQKFEKYSLDQMFMRDKFRTVKAFSEFNIFKKLDNNDIFINDGYVFKMEYPYNEKNVLGFSKKMNIIYENYLKGMNVFYSIIPDKNYYIKNNDKHLSIDYKNMITILNRDIKNMKYIDILDCLSLDDYYRTDIHWRQENLELVVRRLAEQMGLDNVFNINSYDKKTFAPFYGSFYGQAALSIKSDTLTYLTNNVIENAIVDNLEFSGDDNESQKVYDVDKLSGIDSYDVFLSGATPLIEVTNPGNTSSKELIIFRDSFASSIAPLLLNKYSKITLVDLRYINADLLGQFIDFNNQDVLFLYNTTIVNNSHIIVAGGDFFK